MFFIEYCSKCRFLCSFRRNSEFSQIFPSRIFSKLKWLKDAGQRQTPCRLFTFASLLLCVIAPLIHCFCSQNEPSFCSFCEQKQRISGAVAHCSTWNTVHFVNRSSEAMEQRPSVSRSIPPCMRVWIGALRPAPLHRCALHRCAIRAPQTMTERSSAYPPHYQAIAPLRLCF